MKRSLAIPTAILFIAGAVAFVIFNQNETDEAAALAKGESAKNPAAALSPSRTGGNTGRASRIDPERLERQSRQKDLVEQYGGARAAQAREVSTNVVTILDDVVALGEMMMQGGQQFENRRGMVNGITRRMEIELSDDQQEQALALYDEWQQGELEKSKEAVDRLRDDPTAMMELFLAGDAKERGEMSEDDYNAIREGAAGDLTNVINPLDRSNFRPGRMTGNDQLMDRFAGILDPEQKEKFSTYREQEAAKAGDEAPRNGNITAMKPMPLGTLDEAVSGASKMTSGFRTAMEGMGALQNLRPEGGGETDGE